MKRPLLTLTALAAGSATLLGTGAQAATVPTVSSYITGNIENSATTDTGNQLSLGTFNTNVTTAFANDQGGVWDFDAGSTGSNLGAVNDLEFGTSQAFSVQLSISPGNISTGVAAGSGRTATSGSFVMGFGSTDPYTYTFGPILDSGDNVVAGAGVTQAGLVVVSRAGAPNSATVTANFSGGGSASDTFAIGGSNGGDDTFFGFVAPTGQTITSLVYDGSTFTNVDDFGFVTNVPEPSSLALLAAGGLLVLRRSSAQVARRRRG